VSLSPDLDGFVVAERVGRRFRSPDGEVVHALEDVSAVADRARLTVIAGPSGSGKSTLLALMAALDRPDSGEVYVGGTVLSQLSTRARRQWRRRRVGVVLPQPSDNLTARLDAVGNLRWAAGLRGTELSASALDAGLDEVGLSGAATSALHELSTGQQMRLAFACAVAGRPDLVVADEPTASLDAATSASLTELLARLVVDGVTLVVATHDPGLVAAADDVIRLEHGRRVS
jgi:putative ABC transport system ATP-binding protein